MSLIGKLDIQHIELSHGNSFPVLRLCTVCKARSYLTAPAVIGRVSTAAECLLCGQHRQLLA